MMEKKTGNKNKARRDIILLAYASTVSARQDKKIQNKTKKKRKKK